MPQTIERVQSSIMFASQSSRQGETWRAAAFLRAALVDYCSIEEMQKMDRPNHTHFKLAASVNPLLHILELLRHLNVHVKTVQTMQHSIPVQLEEITSNMNVHIISNLNTSDLAALKNGKYYNKTDIDRIVNWFKKKEIIWGTGDLISLGTTLLAEALCSHYSL